MVEVDAFAADGVLRSACQSGRCPFQALNEELRSAGLVYEGGDFELRAWLPWPA